MKRPRRTEPGRRVRRVASIIREVVSQALITELADPRIGIVTVTGVDVSADMRLADVRVSILGEAKQQEACLAAIQHSRGHVQQKVADALDTRYCPLLRFHMDESVKRSVNLSALIARARAEDEAARADRIRRGVEPLGDEADAMPGPEDAGDEADAMPGPEDAGAEDAGDEGEPA
ncbi:MAG: 30S ribosome-binding factor RbfA [Planctomycetes bacterium]|nr:30S ribosome-binding factor RbfA [Planctomycetota bacterium]